MAWHRIFITVLERDHSPKGPIRMVWALLAVFVAVFFAELAMPGGVQAAAQAHGFIAGRPSLWGIWASMFMHGGILHLLGNSFFLWMYGDNIEDKLGPWSLLGVFLLTGLVATFAHWAAEPSSSIPAIGASGGISGLMGFYAVKFPNATLVIALSPPIGRRRRIVPLGNVRAWVGVALWLAAQLIAGLVAIGQGRSGVLGIAVWAHIGGAVGGLLLGLAALRMGLMQSYPDDGIFVEKAATPPKPKPKLCPECSAPLRPFKRICGQCGKQLPVKYT